MSRRKIGINLASQPFGRERAEVAALAALCLALTVSLIIFTVLFLQDRGRVSVLRASISRDRQQLDGLVRQQNRFQSIIGRPANADVFSKSVFYNQLIARRAVSWTHVFDDLEHVMPADVQLVSLRLPQVFSAEDGGTNHIELDMLVGTQQPQAILPLLKRLEQSSLFGPAEISSQQPPTQNDPLFRFRLSVPYVQTF